MRQFPQESGCGGLRKNITFYVANVILMYYFWDMKLSQYINSLQEKRRLFFTLNEIEKVFTGPRVNLRARIKQLKNKGIIISPLRGLYVIIPRENQSLNSLPPKELVVVIMRHLEVPFYAGLLTAARYHGATHQGLFVFQVVSNKRIKKKIISGDIKIQFIYKKDISNVKIKNQVVRTGYLPISTPEETAKDIMTYYRQCGGLNHQATVLAELAGAINTRKLVSLAKRSGKLYWVQRMGYILENIDTFYEKDRDRVVSALEKFLSTQKLRYVPLAPEMPTKNKPRNKKWKIIENSTIESDV